MSDRTPRLTACRGLPASGKTTYALELLAKAEPGTLARVNRDSLRGMLHDGRYGGQATEKQVTTLQHANVEQLLRSGVDVVVDDTNLRASTLRKLAEIAWKVGADFEVQSFDTPVQECITRDALRPERERVGEDVIRGMDQRYLRGQYVAVSAMPIPERPDVAKGSPYVPDRSLPKAVMVDVDGTVALHVTRDPYDTSRYHEDAPNEPVISAIRAMHDAGHTLIFCSGRHEEFRAVTERWLDEHVGPVWMELHMRPGPGRDDVVKLDLFDKHIRDRWNVVCVFDDRRRVYEMWRSLGLTVMAVAEGNF